MNTPANNVDEYLSNLPMWQRDKLSMFRNLVHEVAPETTEDIKWAVPVFFIGGKMVFAMSAFKAHVKYNFILNGALLDDVDGLFNNGLESKKNRSIDLQENETIDKNKLRALISQAIKR